MYRAYSLSNMESPALAELSVLPQTADEKYGNVAIRNLDVWISSLYYISKSV